MEIDPLISPADLEARAQAAHTTMADICRRAGIPDSTYRRWKMGRQSPKLETIDRLRAAMAECEEEQRAIKENHVNSKG